MASDEPPWKDLVERITADLRAAAEKLGELKLLAPDAHFAVATSAAAILGLDGKRTVNDRAASAATPVNGREANSGIAVHSNSVEINDAKPGMDKDWIRPNDLATRHTKSSLYVDIILIFLLNNQERSQPIILQEILQEFKRLGINQTENAVRTRLSRMKPAYLHSNESDIDSLRPGQYRLSGDGVKEAEVVVGKRKHHPKRM
jgi:hypothetical protein